MLRRTAILSAIAACLLIPAAEGKDGRRYGYDNRSYGGGGGIIGRTLADLDRAARNGRLDDDRHEDYQKAVENLIRFDDRWRREGKFDKDRLDKAIEKIDDLAGSSRVDPRDRAVLSRDLAELRAFRSDRGRSAYYRGGPYSDSYGDFRTGRYPYDDRIYRPGR